MKRKVLIAKKYLGKDKFEHIGISFLISLFAGILINPLFGFIAAVILGICKEIYDYFHPEKEDCEVMDVVADLIGAAIGFIIASIF